jgi:drug/metabolite transporter (DMT)-like permease
VFNLTHHSVRVGLALALLASFLFSLKPIIIKHAYELGGNSETLMVLRMWMALPFYGAMLFLQRKQLIKHKRYLPAAIAVGFLGYFLSSYLDLLALQTISAQAERIILYAYPSLVVLIKAIYERKPPSKKVLTSLLLVYAGILLLLPGELSLTGSPLGLLLMMCCAFTFALYVILSKPLISNMGVGVFTSTAMVASCLFTQINFISIDLHDIEALPTSVYGLALALAFFSTVIPSYAMSAAIAKIGPERTAITGTTGPVFTTILAVALLNEVLTPFHVIGLSFTVIGVYVLSRASK